MARDLAGSTFSNLYVDQAVITDFPFTFAAWFNTDTTSGAGSILYCGVDDDGKKEHGMLQNGTSFQALSQDGNGTNVQATSTATLSTSTWYHGCAVFAAADSRAAYVDGGDKGTNTTSRNPTGFDQTVIGQRVNNLDDQPFNGRIAEVAAWDVALTDAEVAHLATGVQPAMVRPESLVAYWPLIGRYDPEIDLVGGFDLIVNPSTPPVVADHARVLYPASPFLTTAAAGGGGGGGSNIPAIYWHLRQQGMG